MEQHEPVKSNLCAAPTAGSRVSRRPDWPPVGRAVRLPSDKPRHVTIEHGLALVAGGGLGRYIIDGLALQEYGRLVAGALLVAALALGTELAFGVLERSSRHTAA